ncbi:aminoacyl-tRNA hydrolase [Victivallis sp.]|uniref:aminoacyl-tRNA hydrolase n=1 Tax=Victivallis sp. TaxID=2049020 RepID=UPI0025DC722E|nr:aminoacyl-tRNA hydrolase [uncultured Victivallis sp.]
MDEIGLIVGLGNPGPEYAGTRHNAGFMVIDRLLAGFPAGRFEERHTASSSVWAGKFRGRALLLQKPLTFMNLSGQAVALLARRSGIQPESILVISDDLDLPVGRLRLRNGGADGGHNGLKSIIAELGSSSFRRLRIGIGRPKPGETVDYVLSKFEGEEERRFEASLAAAAEAVRTVLTGGMARAMNRFNAWTPVEESETNQKKEVLS